MPVSLDEKPSSVSDESERVSACLWPLHRSPPAGPPRAGRRVVLVLDEEETAPPPPPDTLRAGVAKGVKKFLLQ